MENENDLGSIACGQNIQSASSVGRLKTLRVGVTFSIISSSPKGAIGDKSTRCCLFL